MQSRASSDPRFANQHAISLPVQNLCRPISVSNALSAAIAATIEATKGSWFPQKPEILVTLPHLFTFSLVCAAGSHLHCARSLPLPSCLPWLGRYLLALPLTVPFRPLAELWRFGHRQWVGQAAPTQAYQAI